MTYRQLQLALKELRNQGKTSIKLNLKKVVLQAEYDHLRKPSPVVQFELWLSNHSDESGLVTPNTRIRNEINRRALGYGVVLEIIEGGMKFVGCDRTFTIAA